MWLPWSVVAWRQIFAQVRSCACYADSWSSIVPFCCTDDLQDSRYFMELICNVPAEPLPMQILALASNAGKANQVSSCKLAVANSDGSKAHKLWTCKGLDLPLQCCHANAGYPEHRCSHDVCHRQPHLDCLAYLSQFVLYQINVSKLPLLALIYQNNMSWRSYRMFFRDPSMATSKQTYPTCPLCCCRSQQPCLILLSR